MTMYVLVTSSGCGPCEQELADLASKHKYEAFGEDDNFLIIDLMDEGHRPWVQLLQPQVTPSMYAIHTGADLNIKNHFTGVHCVDRCMLHNKLNVTWNHQGDLFNQPVVLPEQNKAAVEDDPESQEVADAGSDESGT